jgi:hypothetical protein
VEQSPQANSAVTLIATWGGQGGFNQFAIVAKQQTLTDDIASPITCRVAVSEFDGGDSRAPKQWGDFFVDMLPAAFMGVGVTPMSLGAPAAPQVLIPSGAVRTRAPASVGGVVVSDFMGMYFLWVDDYGQQAAATKLYLWQPSFVIQPAATIAWATFGS